MKKHDYNISHIKLMQSLKQAELKGRKKAIEWTIMFMLHVLYEQHGFRKQRLIKFLDELNKWTHIVHDDVVEGEEMLLWAKQIGIYEYLLQWGFTYEPKRN